MQKTYVHIHKCKSWMDDSCDCKAACKCKAYMKRPSIQYVRDALNGNTSIYFHDKKQQ